MAKDTRLEYRLGTDFVFRFPILNEAETEAINVSGMKWSFMLKRSVHDADADAIYVRTTESATPVESPKPITIEGAYNVDPAVNELAVCVPMVDTLTDAIKSGDVSYELKRMDAGFEVITNEGQMRLYRSVHHT
jgi:hypothetical protein